MASLRVLARDDILVLDSEYASHSGRLRFVGRRLHVAPSRDQLPDGGADMVCRDRDPVEPGDAFFVEGWERKSEPTEVPGDGSFGQYFRAQVKECALLPADEATALACGVDFSQKGA